MKKQWDRRDSCRRTAPHREVILPFLSVENLGKLTGRLPYCRPILAVSIISKNLSTNFIFTALVLVFSLNVNAFFKVITHSHSTLFLANHLIINIHIDTCARYVSETSLKLLIVCMLANCLIPLIIKGLPNSDHKQRNFFK